MLQVCKNAADSGHICHSPLKTPCYLLYLFCLRTNEPAGMAEEDAQGACRKGGGA